MTKRLTMTLVALAVFVLFAVLPASAISASPTTGLFNGSVIMAGATVPTVFIGEAGLNLTPALTGNTYVVALGAGSPESFKIGWWAPGSPAFPSSPAVTYDLATRYTNFYVSPTDFGPYLGNWYCLTAANTVVSGIAGQPIFVVADPNQAITAWDIRANAGLGQDMTGKSVVRATPLTFKIDTNLASFTTDSAANARGNVRFMAFWNNGTPLTQTNPGSNLWVTQPDTGGFYQWGNATPIPPTAVGLVANLLQFRNVSMQNANVYGPGNYTRTMTFNNTFVTAGESISSSLNLTDAFGTTNVVSAEALDIGPVDINGNLQTLNANPTAARDGFITIKLKDEGGNVMSRLFQDSIGTSNALTNVWVLRQPFYFGNDAVLPNIAFTGANGLAANVFWDTGATDAGLGTALYPAGTYTVWTESTLSNMKDNYKLGSADYGGKTISLSGTVTLVSDTVKIEANKETVVRSKPFSVTITGRPLTQYFVWVKGTSSMSGAWDNQPPLVGLFQAAVYNDSPTNGFMPIGQYVPQNFVNRVLRDDVALDPTTGYNRTRYYVMINTSSSGTRTVEFVTTNWTKAQTYTIRVEQNFPVTPSGFPTVQAIPVPVAPLVPNSDFKSDEVDVKVEKGAVTITAAGDQSYYLGEEIKFSGTNTETATTYLFITGPNLYTQGSRLNDPLMDPRRTSTAARVDTPLWPGAMVVNNLPNTFVQRPVNADNTWDWKWGTANWALDAGTYTVYAVSGPADAQTLARVAYGTVSIIIKKPFVSATASQSTVAQNDKLFITGTAEGKPQQGVAIWVLGKNYGTVNTESVNSDASFSYEVSRAITSLMDAGQYFVVVQHPMQNQLFDIAMCANPNANQVCNYQQATPAGGAVGGATQTIFTLFGQGSLQGTDAAEALVQGINSPNVDDTYTKLVFLVEVASIRIDPIGDRHVGDKFTITATTNLAVDDEVLFNVVSSSFKPTQKSQSGEFSGASGTVKVTKGDSGLNTLSFDVDASTFKPDEYIANAQWVLNSATSGTALFNVLEGAAPTAVPTAVVTAAPTGETTAAPTEVPTAAPTKTPTQPGFGALVALIGLGAVAFFVVRRH